MYRQQDMAFDDALELSASQPDAGVLDRGHPGGRQGVLREARARVEGPVSDAEPAVVGHAVPLLGAGRGRGGRDRGAGPRAGRALRGGRAADRPPEPDEGRRLGGGPARLARLPAGGRRPGRRRAGRRALPGARRARLLGEHRRRCPTVVRHRPDATVLWLDAHADFNTPDTTTSRLPRRHVPGRRVRPVGRRLRPAGARPGRGRHVRRARRRRPRARAAGDQRRRAHQPCPGCSPTRSTAGRSSSTSTSTCSTPRSSPAPFPVAGGLSDGGLRTLLTEVADACELIGCEITGFHDPALAELIAERRRAAASPA